MITELTAEQVAFYTWFEGTAQSQYLLDHLKEAFLAGHNAGYVAGWQDSTDFDKKAKE